MSENEYENKDKKEKKDGFTQIRTSVSTEYL